MPWWNRSHPPRVVSPIIPAKGFWAALQWLPAAEEIAASRGGGRGGGEAGTSVGGSPSASSSVGHATSYTEAAHSSIMHRIDSGMVVFCEIYYTQGKALSRCR